MTLSLDTAYRSFGGEVEASSTPTICRLSDSRRHQLAAIARVVFTDIQMPGSMDGLKLAQFEIGEVEASSPPTICRLSDSRRHQLAAIARVVFTDIQMPGSMDGLKLAQF